jgi:hypothetical protein
LENTHLLGGREYQPKSFGGKNMKRGRENRGKCKNRRKKGEKRKKGEEKGREKKMRKGEVKG